MTKQAYAYVNCGKRKNSAIQNLQIQYKLNLKIFIEIAILIICFLQFGCSQSSSLPKGEVNILDARNIKAPEENIASHKQYDVEVFRSFFPIDNGYSVRYYQKENDTLKSHTATYGDENDFDKAAYTWITDTSVSIRLYSTTSGKEKKFKVYGYGGLSGLETDE